MKYLNENGLLYLVQKIKNWLNGKVDVENGKGLSTNDYTTAEKTKLASLENYTLPTASADTKGGIKVGAGLAINDGVLSATGGGTADSVDWSNVQNKPTKLSDFTNDGDGTVGSAFATEDYVDENGGKIDKIKVNGTEQTITNKAVDITVPTNNNQLTNGAGYQTASDVESAINTKISSTYKAKGTVTFANLPALGSSNEGNVYNVSDSFTTTSDFVEGAGNTYPAGTNVVIINTTGQTYKYDVLSGMTDLSGYYTKAEQVAITNAEIDTICA